MCGKPPLAKSKELGHDFPEEFACFPPVMLGDVSCFWTARGGDDLLLPHTIFSAKSRTNILRNTNENILIKKSMRFSENNALCFLFYFESREQGK